MSASKNLGWSTPGSCSILHTRSRASSSFGSCDITEGNTLISSSLLESDTNSPNESGRDVAVEEESKYKSIFELTDPTTYSKRMNVTLAQLIAPVCNRKELQEKDINYFEGNVKVDHFRIGS